MTVNIQAFLLRRIFPPFIKLNEKIGRRVSDTLFTVSIICIFLMQYLNHANLMGARFIYMFVPFCIFMGIAIFTGLHENMKPVKFRWCMLFWCITGLFAFLTGILICRDHLADFIIMMIVMPVFFMVWSEQTERLIDLTCNAVQISYTCLIVFNMFFFRVTTNYEGCFMNPNTMCMLSVTVFPACIWRLISVREKPLKRIISGILLALSVGVAIITESRAGIAAIGACTVVCIIISVVNNYKSIKRLAPAALIPLVAAMVAAVFLTEPIFNLTYELTELVGDPKVVEEALWDVQPQRYTKIIFLEDEDNINGDNESGAKKNSDEFKVELYSQADETLMNGRTPIWKAYFKASGFLGNSTDDPVPYIDDGIPYKAHNTPLQMAYSFGFPAGICYLVFNIFAGIIALILSLKNKDEINYAIYPVIIAIAFGAYSMIESLVSPVNKSLTLLYFISLTAVVCKSDKILNNID